MLTTEDRYALARRFLMILFSVLDIFHQIDSKDSEISKKESGEYPIFLFDDVLSELDGVRQTHLLKTIQDRVQTFLTTPGLSEITRKLIKEPKLFRISEGKVSVQVPTEIFYPQVEQQ